MARLTPHDRRRALMAGHWNAALWGAGSALTTGPLINFLAHDLGARGRIGGLLMALPALVGLLRLFAPQWIRVCHGPKSATLRALTVSYLICCALPVVGLLAPIFGPTGARALLLGILVPYHLAEYLGSVALWTWLGEIVPRRIRGRYFARRQVWQLVAMIPIAIGASLFTDYFRATYRDQPDLMLLGYAAANGLGALCLLGSVWPLRWMPTAGNAFATSRVISARQIFAPFRDWVFLRLLLFRAWFSFANGISQYVQNIFPKQILKLGVSDLMLMTAGMRVGQTILSPRVGQACDRIGIRPVLIVCQTVVAASLFFFLAASPDTRATAWILSGAYACFIAYAGHNVGLPTLTLKLASGPDKSPFVAASEALGSLCHAGGTILGGFLFDWFDAERENFSILAAGPFVTLFCIGLLARFLAVPLAARIQEPVS